MTNQKNTTPDPTFLPPESEKRKAFLAHARHELRTPLNHIIGYSEMLLEDAEDQSLAGFIPDLAMIGRTARQMLRLINEKLDDSQISADMAPFSAEIGSPLDLVIECIRRLTAEATDLGYASFVPEFQKIELAAARLQSLVQTLAQPAPGPSIIVS